jgi:uncharacterized protein (TIGR03000 family)
MYSAVLMMALTGGAADVPAFGHGCNGCWGGCSGCCGGGWGGGCHGGWGGGCHGCHGGGGLFHRRHGCHGCNGCCGGGCYGGGCYGGGCYGGGYGGCYGGGYGGCYGGGYGGCYGGGYGGCYGGGYGCAGGVIEGGVIMGPAPTGKQPETAPKPTPKDGKAFLAAPATIVVSLPAEAKLTIDGAATRSTSETRVFASPALDPGKEYYYILKADLVRDGKTVSTTKRVTVRAGDETRVTLDFADAAVALR